MKKALVMVTACFLLGLGNVYAQYASGAKDSTSLENKKISDSKNGNENKNTESTPSKKRRSKPPSKAERNKDETFRDDSTDGYVGTRGLSTTPGVSTPIGAGGLGTNENTGHNTSSDIYNIERKDSIKKAKGKRKDSIRKTKGNGKPKEGKKGKPE